MDFSSQFFCHRSDTKYRVSKNLKKGKQNTTTRGRTKKQQQQRQTNKQKNAYLPHGPGLLPDHVTLAVPLSPINQKFILKCNKNRMRNSNTTLKQTNKQTNKKKEKNAHCFFDQIAMNAEASVTCSHAFPA